jgi:hypothetical protein
MNESKRCVRQSTATSFVSSHCSVDLALSLSAMTTMMGDDDGEYGPDTSVFIEKKQHHPPGEKKKDCLLLSSFWTRSN